MSDSMLMISREAALKAADELRSTGQETGTLVKCNAEVSAAQLEELARILREGPKTQITSARGVGAASVDKGAHDLPCFIRAERQSAAHPELLMIDVGIFAGGPYCIDRAGNQVAEPDSTEGGEA